MYSLHAVTLNLLDRLYYLTKYSDNCFKDLREDSQLKTDSGDFSSYFELIWYYSKKAYDNALEISDLTIKENSNKKLIQSYIDNIYTYLNQLQNHIEILESEYDGVKNERFEKLHININSIFHYFQSVFGYCLEANQINQM